MDLESTKLALLDEFSAVSINNLTKKEDFLSNLKINRKVERYVIASIENEISETDCLDWFRKFQNDNQVKDCSTIVEAMYSIISYYKTLKL